MAISVLVFCVIGLVVDALVNNAGYGVPGSFLDSPWPRHEALLQILVVSVAELTHALLPGMIAVALFGFTLSYDEFPRSWVTVGTANTLPLEIWAMVTNITSPASIRISVPSSYCSSIQPLVM